MAIEYPNSADHPILPHFTYRLSTEDNSLLVLDDQLTQTINKDGFVKIRCIFLLVF